jgi:hypothetical protein
VAGFAVGQKVRVVLPKGNNKRGVHGVSVLYTTSMEARFEGAVGTVKEINPRGLYGLPVYLVDFRGQQNRVAIPWQAHWFREEWLSAAEPAAPREVRTDQAAAAQQGERTPVPGPSGSPPQA